MNRRGRELFVPADLTVVVCVDVDEPRGHDRPARVDGLGGGAVALADVDDLAVFDPDVTGVTIVARPIDERPTDNF